MSKPLLSKREQGEIDVDYKKFCRVLSYRFNVKGENGLLMTLWSLFRRNLDNLCTR